MSENNLYTNVLINFSVKLLCILLFLSSNSICFEGEETFCDAYSLDIYLIGKYGTPFILSTLSTKVKIFEITS